jgi:hypothetical protein
MNKKNLIPGKNADPTKLTHLETMFVAAYCITGSALEAARQSGSRGRPDRAAENMMGRKRVREAIAEKTARQCAKLNINSDRVLQASAAIAFSSIMDYTIDDAGNIGLADNANRAALSALKKFKRKVRTIPQRGNLKPIVEVEVELELWSKDSALGKLGEHYHLWGRQREDLQPTDDLTPEEEAEIFTEIFGDKLATIQANGNGHAKGNGGQPTS